MPFIPLSKIIILEETRIRKDMGTVEEIDELAASFTAIGQLNPVILDSNDTLIAGRRRIEAARKLGWDEIKFEYFENLDPIMQKTVELDENRRRKQLSWQEEAAAIAEIHRLKSAGKNNWSITDTAKDLGMSVGKVSEDLKLAEALDNDRVAGRASRRGAIQTLMRERELALVREIAKRRATSIGIKQDDRATTFLNGVLYNADCRTILKEMEEASVDLVITDPPWGIDFDKAAQWSRKWIASYDDSPNAVREMLLEVFPLLFRVLKPSCHLFTFYPIQEGQWWVEHLTEVGFAVRQRPLIWFKTGQPSITDTYTSFLPCYESLLWAYKPGDNNIRKLFRRPIAEAYGFPRPAGIWHVNEKPTELLDRFIEASSEQNEIVLDPFSGGGSTLVSAFGLNRYYIGVELDEVTYKKTCERIRTTENRKEDEKDG